MLKRLTTQFKNFSPAYFAGLCALLFIQIATAACVGDTKGKNLSITLVPHRGVSNMYSAWAPFLDRVGKISGFCFDVGIPARITDFEITLLAGKPDIAYGNPAQAVMAYQRQKYEPLVASGAFLLKGILVVRKDSAIHKLEDLKGQVIDFPSPNAFGASLLLRAQLSELGIKFTPRYVETHQNVYREVVIGITQAGGGIQSTLDDEPESVRSQLRTLYETPGYRPHPLMFNPRVPKNDSLKIKNAILNLEDSESGRALLKAVQLENPVAVSYGIDYAPLNKLNLNKFIVNN